MSHVGSRGTCSVSVELDVNEDNEVVNGNVELACRRAPSGAPLVVDDVA